MKTLTYKKSRIETVLTKDNQPVFIAIIDGTYNTNQTADSNEEKCIEKAKKVIDNSKKRKTKNLQVNFAIVTMIAAYLITVYYFTII